MITKDATELDRQGMRLAFLTAGHSKCHRDQVGCAIYYRTGGTVTGRNGHPRRTADDGSCLRDELKVESGTHIETGFCTHAEQNALLFSDFSRLEGCRIYITRKPCGSCLKSLMQSGASDVYYVGSLGLEELNLIRRLDPASVFWSADEYTGPEITRWRSETHLAFALTAEEMGHVSLPGESGSVAKTANPNYNKK